MSKTHPRHQQWLNQYYERLRVNNPGCLHAVMKRLLSSSNLGKTFFLSLSTALATLLYGDWLPQVNGSPRILLVLRRGSLHLFQCHQSVFVDNSNLLDEKRLI